MSKTQKPFTPRTATITIKQSDRRNIEVVGTIYYPPLEPGEDPGALGEMVKGAIAGALAVPGQDEPPLPKWEKDGQTYRLEDAWIVAEICDRGKDRPRFTYDLCVRPNQNHGREYLWDAKATTIDKAQALVEADIRRIAAQTAEEYKAIPKCWLDKETT